jgi:signal transduction histidine kinase
MRFSRTLRVIGYALFAIVGFQAAFDRHTHVNSSLAWWSCAYAVFGASIYVAAAGIEKVETVETNRRRTIAALLVMIPAMLAMAVFQPCHFVSLALVIVASMAALVLRPATLAALIAVQTLPLGFVLVCGEHVEESVATILVVLAGQVLAAIAVRSALGEAQMRNALARANAELRATQSLLEETSRANERTRIARELHDVLGHDLTALALQLEVASNLAPERAGSHVAKAQQVGARLLENVRGVVSSMRDAPAPDLANALRKLVEGIPGLRVHLAMPDVLHVEDGARSHCILRCVQEIVTNTMRHADAGNLWITIAQDEGAIRVEARDDGRGSTGMRVGHGIAGMRARIEELGGWLRIAAEPSREFAVSAWLPERMVAP